MIRWNNHEKQSTKQSLLDGKRCMLKWDQGNVITCWFSRGSVTRRFWSSSWMDDRTFDGLLASSGLGDRVRFSATGRRNRASKIHWFRGTWTNRPIKTPPAILIDVVVSGLAICINSHSKIHRLPHELIKTHVSTNNQDRKRNSGSWHTFGSEVLPRSSPQHDETYNANPRYGWPSPRKFLYFCLFYQRKLWVLFWLHLWPFACCELPYTPRYQVLDLCSVCVTVSSMHVYVCIPCPSETSLVGPIVLERIFLLSFSPWAWPSGWPTGLYPLGSRWVPSE